MPSRHLILLILISTLFGCGGQGKLELKPLGSQAVILALGDSLTYGTGAEKSESYPAQLALLLHRPVINAGVPGDTSAQGLQRLPDLLEEYQPQLVIVMLGGNDLLRRYPKETIQNNLSQVVTLLKNKSIDLILIAPPKPAIFLSAPSFYEELSEKYHIIVDTDLLPDLLSQKKYKSDQIHLNKAGYKQLAEGIYQIMINHHAVAAF